ncbi:iron-sulfur cluster-binding protein [Candidatus Sumerlaeota bacterium]|nr:iron-sulfur cluster-binding protein [Candidatus Sumerlaeota bacterium]
MSYIEMEKEAQGQTAESLAAVRDASEKKVISRRNAFGAKVKDLDGLRQLAARIKQHTLDNLPHYLEQAEKRLTANGIQVHWAADADEARRIFKKLCDRVGPGLIAKSKSMVTEEIHLNDFLEQHGYQPVETDLGEFVVQIAHDRPSHIVTPIIHINGRQVAKLFEKEGLGKYTEDPEELTMQARAHLREIYRKSSIGVTGGNFVCCETGRIVTCTNEGNLRMSAQGAKIQVSITGIEKVVPREADMAVLLNLLARSSTGQDLTVYTQWVSGPRQEGEIDGPEEVHLIFIDNGRTNLLGGKYHEMLRCIRCGACMNVCPVYRAQSGHSYESVYPGPMGAVISPLLGGEESLKTYAQLPKASSLCAACEEVCPVAIPIPKLLLSLRDELHGKAPALGGLPSFAPWAMLASSPLMWKTALKAGGITGWGPAKLAAYRVFGNWLSSRELPEWPRESFRAAWKKRKGNS